MKKSIRLALVLILNIIILVCFSASGIMVFATEENFDFNSAEIQLLCKNLTESDDVRGELTLDQYVEKISNNGYGTSTEQLLEHGEDLKNIIPVEALSYPGEYLYVGKEYAFFIQVYTGELDKYVYFIDYDYEFDTGTELYI